MLRIILKLLTLIIFAAGVMYPQSSDAYKSLYKLGSTPFINKSRMNAGLSFGVNYGSPSKIIQQWQLPDFNKDILFKEVGGYLSFGSKAEVHLKYTEGYMIAYNFSYLGKEQSLKRYDYGVKYKFIESEGYVPDAAVDLSSEYPVSLSAGSSDESLKYYASIDFVFFYILLPLRYSAGAAYSFNDYISVFLEGNLTSAGDNPFSESFRFGTDFSLLNYVHLDIALFYFDFRFRDANPGRTGFTWQDPDHIMTMPEKNKYYLLSSSIFVNLDILK